MRLFDKFITTWGNTIIKSLVIFSVIYICAMFIRVETLHSRFEKRLEQITINQSNIINEIKTIKFVALSNLTNQGIINVDVQNQLDNK